MDISLITPEDLQVFRQTLKQELLHEIRERLKEYKEMHTKRQWLKSHDVMRLLLIAPSTLQSMRVKGLLPYSKVGGVIYYDLDDVRRMMDQARQPAHEKIK